MRDAAMVQPVGIRAEQPRHHVKIGHGSQQCPRDYRPATKRPSKSSLRHDGAEQALCDACPCSPENLRSVHPKMHHRAGKQQA